MSRLQSFSWLLKLIYKVSRISGFIYTRIDFNSYQKAVIKKSHANTILFALSMVLSFLGTFYDNHFPIAEATHSKFMDFGLNSFIRMSLWSSFFLKAFSIIQSQRFFNIIDNLQSNDLKVNSLGFAIIETINKLIYFIPVKKNWPSFDKESNINNCFNFFWFFYITFNY